MAKYTLKIAAVPAETVVDFWLAIRGKHTTQRYGALRGLRERPEDEYTLECELCGSERYHYVAVDRNGVLSPVQAGHGDTS